MQSTEGTELRISSYGSAQKAMYQIKEFLLQKETADINRLISSLIDEINLCNFSHFSTVFCEYILVGRVILSQRYFQRESARLIIFPVPLDICTSQKGNCLIILI